jgi:ATP-binding cassette subfamily B protein
MTMAQQTTPPRPHRDLGSLAMLVGYLRPYVGRVVGASVALLTAAGLVLGLGQGLRQLIDHGFGMASRPAWTAPRC